MVYRPHMRGILTGRRGHNEAEWGHTIQKDPARGPFPVASGASAHTPSLRDPLVFFDRRQRASVRLSRMPVTDVAY